MDATKTEYDIYYTSLKFCVTGIVELITKCQKVTNSKKVSQRRSLIGFWSFDATIKVCHIESLSRGV